MFILFWIGFCIVPALIASNKGRSAAGWFFGSLLISPLLGGIIVACLPALTKEVERRAIETGEMRKCPFCAELVKAEAKICRYCQRELPELEIKPYKKFYDVTARPSRCTVCGGPVVDRENNLVQCDNCGAAFRFAY